MAGPSAVTPSESMRAQAWVLGSRLDLRGLSPEALVAQGPHVYQLGPGRHVAAFRYGAVVFFGTPEPEQSEWVRALAGRVDAPLDEPERDELEIRFAPEARDGLDSGGVLVLQAADVERLQVVAHALAKSTVLAHYEERVGEDFRHVEERAQEPEPRPTRRRSRELLARFYRPGTRGFEQRVTERMQEAERLRRGEEES